MRHFSRVFPFLNDSRAVCLTRRCPACRLGMTRLVQKYRAVPGPAKSGGPS